MLVMQILLDWVTIVLADNTKALDHDALLMDWVAMLLCAVTILLAGDTEALD
jgi:hypothetical protein